MAQGKALVYEDFEKEWYTFNPNLKLAYTEKPTNVRGQVHCHCEICGCDYDSTIYNLKMAMKRNSKYKGCRVCSNQMIVEGVNDLLTQAPHIEKYLVDKEQAKHIGVCPNSNRKIEVRCDKCGRTRQKNVYDLVRYGVSCPYCGDGFSIPNKIIRNLMSQVKVRNLKFEYSDNWTLGRIYDVYFEKNRKKYVVEMDGEQHFRDAFYITEEQHRYVDTLKDFLAIGNNVNIIRIDCSTGKFTDIKQNLMDSELKDLLNLTDEMVDKCKEAYNSNIFLNVIEDRKQGATLKEISDKYNIGRSTALRYLHKGEDLGLLEAFERVDREKIFYGVIEDRKKGYTLSQLMERHNICKGTVLRYLHRGEDIGLLKAFKDNGIYHTKVS